MLISVSVHVCKSIFCDKLKSNFKQKNPHNAIKDFKQKNYDKQPALRLKNCNGEHVAQ